MIKAWNSAQYEGFAPVSYTGRENLREEIKARSLIRPYFLFRLCHLLLRREWGCETWRCVYSLVCWVDSLLGLCVDMGFRVHRSELRSSSWLLICVVVRDVSRHLKGEYLPFRDDFGTVILGDSENVHSLYPVFTFHTDEMGIVRILLACLDIIIKYSQLVSLRNISHCFLEF